MLLADLPYLPLSANTCDVKNFLIIKITAIIIITILTITTKIYVVVFIYLMQ